MENVSQVGVTIATSHFGPDHPMGLVHQLFNVGIFEFVEESWPATPALELLFGGKQRHLADNALVDAVVKE